MGDPTPTTSVHQTGESVPQDSVSPDMLIVGLDVTPSPTVESTEDEVPSGTSTLPEILNVRMEDPTNGGPHCM